MKLSYRQTLMCCKYNYKLYLKIKKLNPNLIFESDPFNQNYERLVFFNDNKKYSLLFTNEDKFNECKFIPNELNSILHESICISNKINITTKYPRISNYTIINNKIIIFDEDVYLWFIDNNIQCNNLVDYIYLKLNENKIVFDQIISFENDHLVISNNNILSKHYYKNFII